MSKEPLVDLGVLSPIMSEASLSIELLDAQLKDLKFTVLNNDTKMVIWFSENHFPIDLVNTGVPGVDDWQGDHDILDALKAVEAAGYIVEMFPRTDGDETGFVCNGHQDFKLVICQNNLDLLILAPTFASSIKSIANKDVKHVETGKSASFWFTDNLFPHELLHKNDDGSLDGNYHMTTFLLMCEGQQLDNSAYLDIDLVERTIGDETGYNIKTLDKHYKLVFKVKLEG